MTLDQIRTELGEYFVRVSSVVGAVVCDIEINFSLAVTEGLALNREK